VRVEDGDSSAFSLVLGTFGEEVRMLLPFFVRINKIIII
jgi:hypothetical protein